MWPWTNVVKLKRLCVSEPLSPLVPLLFESWEDKFQVAADVLAAVHWMRKRNCPNTPTARLKWTDLCHRSLVCDLPYEACATIVRRDDECVSLLARLGLEIGNLAKLEAIHDDIFEHLKTMVDGRTFGLCNVCRLCARSASCIGVNCKRAPFRAPFPRRCEPIERPFGGSEEVEQIRARNTCNSRLGSV